MPSSSGYFTADDDTISFCRPPGLTDAQWETIRVNVADALERAGCKRVAS